MLPWPDIPFTPRLVHSLGVMVHELWWKNTPQRGFTIKDNDTSEINHNDNLNSSFLNMAIYFWKGSSLSYNGTLKLIFYAGIKYPEVS